MKIATTMFCAVLALTTSANAAFNLQITEIWPGNEPGENLTSDWFEVTNFGDMPWVEGTDGFLWFDDDSQDAALADLMSGVPSIAPGESVVFIDDADTTEFAALWGPVITLPQLGIHAGSGLSQGGDGVTLFLTATNTQPTGLLDIIDFELYPDAALNGGQSYDVVRGVFGGSHNTAPNNVGQVANASPGILVPEPAAAALALLAATGLLAGRRV